MMEDVARLLKTRGATVAAAESCTGGRISAAFTAMPGASEYFVGGIVAYSNDVKMNVLGVSSCDLARFGAVSRPVAEQMALGACRIVGADYAVATSGIAGPGGATPGKPVGTVWIAVAGPAMDISAGAGDGSSADRGSSAGPDKTVTAREFLFSGSREEIMRQSVDAATEMLRDALI